MNIQCTPAMADALSKILNAESIQYSHGYGPTCVVIIIDPKDVKRTKKALSQWKDAVDLLWQEVNR